MGVEGMVAKTVTAKDVDELIRRKFALEDMRSRMFGVGMPVQHVDICVPNVADFEAIAQAVERTPTARFRRDDGPDALCIEYGCCTFWCDVHNRRTVG